MNHQRKKLLYISSSRDRRTVIPDTQEYFRQLPFGHAAVLANLEKCGWSNKRLAWKEVRSIRKLAVLINDYNPDIILTNSVAGLHPILAQRFCGALRAPVVHAWDDFYSTIWKLNFGTLAGLAMRFWERWIITQSDAIITISRYHESQAKDWGRPTFYIPNGCDIPKNYTNSTLKLSGTFKIVYCGNQEDYKGTADLVLAMRELPDNFMLYLVGTPNPALKQIASDNTVFLGFVPECDKWSAIEQADIVVCTANTDCNAKFHEYLRMKRPILAYDGMPNLLFENRRNAYLTKDYAEGIRQLAQSTSLRTALVENAMNDIPVYTWHEIAEKYASAFDDILRHYNEGSKAHSISVESEIKSNKPCYNPSA